MLPYGINCKFFLLIGLRADLAVIETLEKFLDLFSVQAPALSGIPLSAANFRFKIVYVRKCFMCLINYLSLEVSTKIKSHHPV